MKPVLQSLLLADHVYSDQATGKKIIAGVFNRVQRMKPPPKPPEGEAPRPMPIPAGGLASTPFVYLALTELRGKSDFILELTDLAENIGLFKVGFTNQDIPTTNYIFGNFKNYFIGFENCVVTLEP